MEKEKNNYKTFGITLTISFVIMYAVMFFNVDKLDHIYLSTTRLYMTLLMVAPMALVMLGMMRKMYQDKKLNTIISISAVVVLIGAFVLLRTQTPIGDVQYMKAMIPHHSSAILTSQEATITDPEVRKLADEIIKAQKEEIAEMKRLLDKLN